MVYLLEVGSRCRDPQFQVGKKLHIHKLNQANLTLLARGSTLDVRI